LARIHRLTLDGLRRQIAPVEPDGYMRFLLSHHGIADGTRGTGPGALGRALNQLQGFESAAGAWEMDLLPSRVAAYETHWLDALFTSGEFVWGRLQPPLPNDDKRGQMLTRASAISFAARADLAWLLPPDRAVPSAAARWDAQSVYESLSTHGALFFNDLLAATSLLPSQLEVALRELAALGLVTSDAFATIRALVSKQQLTLGRWAGRRGAQRRERVYSRGGRWSKFPPFVQPVTSEERNERWAWLLLNRYGVIFRDLLVRESTAPPWRELARIYRRLEMRGEIRGGRFVRGVAGEQFALTDAVERLRKHRDASAEPQWNLISAADPLNLVGIITRDPRVPAKRGNRVLFLNGRPVAARESRQIRWIVDLQEPDRLRATQLLNTPGSLRHDDAHTLLMKNAQIRAS
jgi:ATP-dependent Lhr-like helicase